MFLNMTNKTGTTKRSAIVPMSIPPTVPTPIEMLPFAPTPVENISGNIPNIIVNDVIKIALNLALAADIAAMTIDIPSALLADAYSVIKMAVFANNPISIRRPICKYMLFSNPYILANKKLPARPKGTDKMTTIGMRILSYKAQSIK